MSGFYSGNGGCLWSLTPRRPALRNASGNQGMRTSVRDRRSPRLIAMWSGVVGVRPAQRGSRDEKKIACPKNKRRGCATKG